MKNMMKLLAVCITIGIVCVGYARTSYAQFINTSQAKTEFSYTAISYHDLTYDDPNDANYYPDELNGSLWQYKRTINPNNKWSFSYLNVASTQQYDTGRYWAVNNQAAIYEGTRQEDAATLGFQHFRPLHDNNAVKLYVAPAFINSNYVLTIEYLNNPILPPTEFKGSATDAYLDIGFAFYPLEVIEIIISSNYESNLSDTDIDNDDDLKSGYQGYHVNLEYRLKRNTTIALGAYHDDENPDASYTSIGYNGAITPRFGLNVEYTSYGDDRYIFVFGPSFAF